MRYRKVKSQSYGQRKPKMFVPKGLKGKTLELYRAAAIRPAGNWSRDLLENTPAGKILAAQHFKHVVETLKKEKPENKTEMEKTLKKAMMTPQQKLVILCETSLSRPLTTKEFHEYMELFKTCFPEAYKSLYGKKSPSQIVAETAEEAVKNKNSYEER